MLDDIRIPIDRLVTPEWTPPDPAAMKALVERMQAKILARFYAKFREQVPGWFYGTMPATYVVPGRPPHPLHFLLIP